MKFKHRTGRSKGKIDVNGTKYDIVDGYFEIEDPQDATVTLLKRNGHEPVVESKTGSLSVDELTQIDGIGPAYAEQIVDIYGTAEELFEAGAEDIAERISGVSVSKAEDIIASLRTP